MLSTVLFMAAAAFRASLRDCGPGVPRGLALWHQSQTQGPPDYPSFVESVDEYRLPPKHELYPTPSGWQPPRDPLPNLPYFVRRSRMRNIHLYKDVTHGNRQMTVIRKVEGDIWVLQKDVEDFLSSLPFWGKGSQGRAIGHILPWPLGTHCWEHS
uniref:Large ribosomal subunit protein mL49 n=1 Tax=Sciurus vulgaris TaxID=55149 RepID=A0A8D2CZ32_SCIVU